MLRNFMTLCPALAFALTGVTATLTMAYPFAPGQQPIGPKPGQIEPDFEPEFDDSDDYDDYGDWQLAMCTELQLLVQTDDRAYDCRTLTGPSCLASCAGETGETAATCRSQCEADGAVFCAPAGLKTRDIGIDDDDDDDLIEELEEEFDDDDDHGGDELVYVNTESCLELNQDR